MTWRASRLCASRDDVAEMMYALPSFPFMLFLVPILGEALHGSQPTGYNRSGLLTPKLANSQVVEKEELERRRAEMLDALEENRILRDWHHSNTRRVMRILCFHSNRWWD